MELPWHRSSYMATSIQQNDRSRGAFTSGHCCTQLKVIAKSLTRITSLWTLCFRLSGG